MSFGYIYKTTNTTNGKIYVGKKHSDRFIPKYKGSGIRLAEALAKYGEEAFNVEILEWCDTLEELNNAEIRWIRELNSTDMSIGYNISHGGDGGCVWEEGHHPSLGVRRRGEDNPFYGKHHSDKTKQLVKNVWKEKIASGYISPARGKKKISKDGVVKLVNLEELETYLADGWKRPETHKKLDHPYKHSEETKKKISDTMKGRVVTDESIQKFKETLSKRSDEDVSRIRRNMSDSHKGKAWVHNDEHFLMIDGKDLQYYLDKGYSRGRGQKKLK